MQRKRPPLGGRPVPKCLFEIFDVTKRLRTESLELFETEFFARAVWPVERCELLVGDADVKLHHGVTTVVVLQLDHHRVLAGVAGQLSDDQIPGIRPSTVVASSLREPGEQLFAKTKLLVGLRRKSRKVDGRSRVPAFEKTKNHIFSS